MSVIIGNPAASARTDLPGPIFDQPNVVYQSVGATYEIGRARMRNWRFEELVLMEMTERRIGALKFLGTDGWIIARANL